MSDQGFSAAALWNRTHVDLRSREIIAQILDRGSLDDWRHLYRLCARDAELRQRVTAVVLTVPLAHGHFWLAALAGLGVDVQVDRRLPAYDSYGT
ncbi:MAG: hypothetical protein AB1505_28630 [Candidatus Latescibacterota bacterium]